MGPPYRQVRTLFLFLGTNSNSTALLLRDSTFPGIGVPAVLASGAIVANSLVSVSKHTELLDAVVYEIYTNLPIGVYLPTMSVLYLVELLESVLNWTEMLLLWPTSLGYVHILQDYGQD
ncbi:hypothetical protein SAY87_020687 [Trapa incisa]|uniref:Uncharacterized protein n=1 Tax=Trapa incisa TaxID=236973 RepID=A0AAN7JQ86_9MYRT|nr:hypothetical protein SAY87_020687 [Trapa incisa]